MKRERNVVFDLMKGVALCFVMFNHLCAEASHQFFHSIDIPLFLILSGYFAKVYIHGSNKHIIAKDFARLIIPFFVTMLLLSVWGILQSVLKQNWILALRHPLSLLWASGDAIKSEKFGLIYAGPMWFLIALFWTREIFYYGAGWITTKYRKWGDEVVVFLSLIISFFAKLIHPYVDPFPWSVLQGIAMLVFYSIGWYVSRHHIPVWTKILCVVCWPLAIKWGGIDLSSCVYNLYLLDIMGSCGAVIVVYLICKWTSMALKKIDINIYTQHITLMQWIGLNTMAVLCMHTFDLHSGMIYSVLIRLPFEVSAWALVGVRMLLAIGLAWLVTKMPGLKRVYR